MSEEDLTAGEYMTYDQIAQYTRRTRGNVPSWLSRRKIKGQMMARTEDVISAYAAMLDPADGRRAKPNLAR